MKNSKKVVLAYSGGLDTSVILKWLIEKGFEVVCFVGDVGQKEDFEAVKKKGEEKNPKCLKCHATAYGQGGYKIDDPSAKKFEGVGCESCHGPGSVYKKTKIMKDRALALKSGMTDINEKTCTGCHDGSDHAGKIDYKEALKKIDHTYRKK